MNALSRALDLWRSGRRLPPNHAAELVEEGYDPGSLQRFHLRNPWPKAERPTPS